MQCVFAVYDSRAEQYGMFFPATNPEVAARMFADAILHGPETIMRMHPEDFALKFVGTFDEETGALVGQSPSHVVSASQVQWAMKPDKDQLPLIKEA